MRRFGLPVALVLAVTVLAGCGGGNGAEGAPTGPEGAPLEGVDAYLEEVRAADGTLRSSTDRLAAGATTTPELEAILEDLEQAVRRVEQATPPYDLLPPHQRLTQSMWGAIDEGHGIAAEGADEVSAADLGSVVDALDDAAEALDEMEDMGYEVRRRT
jgi:hypothetical protein